MRSLYGREGTLVRRRNQLALLAPVGQRRSTAREPP